LLQNFLFELFFGLILCTLLTSQLSILFSDLLLLYELLSISLGLYFFLLNFNQRFVMTVLRGSDPMLDHLESILYFAFVICQEVVDTFEQPGENIFV